MAARPCQYCTSSCHNYSDKRWPAAAAFASAFDVFGHGYKGVFYIAPNKAVGVVEGGTVHVGFLGLGSSILSIPETRSAKLSKILNVLFPLRSQGLGTVGTESVVPLPAWDFDSYFAQYSHSTVVPSRVSMLELNPNVSNVAGKSANLISAFSLVEPYWFRD